MGAFSSRRVDRLRKINEAERSGRSRVPKARIPKSLEISSKFYLFGYLRSSSIKKKKSRYLNLHIRLTEKEPKDSERLHSGRPASISYKLDRKEDAERRKSNDVIIIPQMK